MNTDPWKHWVPGVLSNKQLKELCDKNIIEYVKNPEKTIDFSSLDLTLSNDAYLMKEGSVKPFGPRYLNEIKSAHLIEKINPNESGEFLLKAKHTYIFKTVERLGRFNAPVFGQATAKSSIGRVDVLARLIVDGMDCYECFTCDKHEKAGGEMFIEITPMTFNVKVKEGIPLSQLRLFYDSPEVSEIRGEVLCKSLLHDAASCDGSLSVDLSETEIYSGNRASAFCAKNDESLPPIPLWEKNSINPKEYWTLEKKDKKDRLIIKKINFTF